MFVNRRRRSHKVHSMGWFLERSHGLSNVTPRDRLPIPTRMYTLAFPDIMFECIDLVSKTAAFAVVVLAPSFVDGPVVVVGAQRHAFTRFGGQSPILRPRRNGATCCLLSRIGTLWLVPTKSDAEHLEFGRSLGISIVSDGRGRLGRGSYSLLGQEGMA